MSRVEAVAGMDRLPWLPDEPAARPDKRRRVSAIASALAALLLAGASAVWFAARDIEAPVPPASTKLTTTVRLPAARPAVPAQPQVRMEPLPEVETIVAPPMPVIEPPPVVKRAPERTVTPPREALESAPAVVDPSKPVQRARLEPWPVRVVEGAAGRLVRVGAFSSVHQAKRGWWAIVRVNPTLKRLPALVVPVRSLSNGRVYYRLRMGTTSQAHSAVLCQRMRAIAQPCVVVG